MYESIIRDDKLMEEYINLTPYKEIIGGEESIYDHIKEGYTVPEKVIEYLRTTKPYCMCPALYQHPFRKDVTLAGPYLYCDEQKYCWDRDTWKYVVKYGLTLPQEFIDHVMSKVGTEFIQKCKESGESWSGKIDEMKNRENTLCLLPADAGDMELENF